MPDSVTDTTEATWLDVISYPVRLEVISTLVALVEASASEIIDRSHASDPTVRRHLDALIDLGVVGERQSRGDGITPGRPPTLFLLLPNVRDEAAALLDALKRPIGTAPQRTPSRRWDR